MNQNHLKSISRAMLAVLFAAFTFAACNNSGDKKKEEPAKTDTVAPTPAPAPTTPDSTGAGDTLKQKPTAPGD
ncbi:MAG: hypothetical protein ABL876_04995 [Chitinophagaceae bacterium]